MKRMYYVLFTFFIGTLIFYALKVEAVLPLTGRTIVIDAGHGNLDPGTSYAKIYEKDINLKISKYLEKELGSLGANVIMTRNADYDLAAPNATYRKKSDFDNRIKLINESEAHLYISIHQNYLSDASYYGPQVFYNADNKNIATIIQESMNAKLQGKREIKEIPQDTYMYSKLKVPGVLIECGFLSNGVERQKLNSAKYQEKIAHAISEGVIKYFNN